jgi:ribosomal protein S18 acetylase RimI-like enzyme
MPEGPTRFRRQLAASDPANIEALVRATGFFSAEEIGIARELADDAASNGLASHYRFLLAGEPEAISGYACFGPVPCTVSSWDLYWIAVAPDVQSRGLGRSLLGAAEEAIARAGGTRLYVDTSSRAQYGPTRRFYAVNGYSVVADMPDFYAPGDGKIVFVKGLGSR